MKDFNGLELRVGDDVATTVRGYADITKWKVIGFTPQKIKLSAGDNTIMKFPSQVSYVTKNRGEVQK